MFVDVVITILALLTVVAQALVVLLSAYFIFFAKTKSNFLIGFISDNAISLGFFVSLIATLGSLFFSDVTGFLPCELCWFQRVFMYPQVILLGLAWLRKDEKIIDYSLAVAAVGATISVYHNYIYYAAQKIAVCSTAAPCTTSYVLEFGYITIPLMALTGFLSLIFLLVIRKTHSVGMLSEEI